MKHLTLVQEDDPRAFVVAVEDFLNHKKVLSTKYQRNLYYSLSGSTHVAGKEYVEDGKKLLQSHLAFIVWEDKFLVRLANFFKRKEEKVSRSRS